MAKKYLLYIHDERFDLEPKKSELVNALLTRHYSSTSNTLKDIVEAQAIFDSAVPKLEPVIDQPPYVTPVPEPEIARKVSSFIKPDLKYCKNGHPLDERGRCFGKGCKYA